MFQYKNIQQSVKLQIVINAELTWNDFHIPNHLKLMTYIHISICTLMLMKKYYLHVENQVIVLWIVMSKWVQIDFNLA